MSESFQEELLPEEKPKKKTGRPKNPVYWEMHPVEELYIKVRNLTRKSSKRIPLGHVELLREERILLAAKFPGLKLNPTEEEIENMVIPEPPEKDPPPSTPQNPPKYVLNLDDT